MADQSAEGLLSPWLKKQRFKAVQPYLRGRVLDFGCGSGALATLVEPERYLGVDVDATSLMQARAHYPNHRFISDLSNTTEKFDSIISLAVIEHVSNPSMLMSLLTTYLVTSPEACIIFTTPHPGVDWIHNIGATLGLFSKHANEEHEDLLDLAKLKDVGKLAGLNLVFYSRFLLGANQLAVFKK